MILCIDIDVQPGTPTLVHAISRGGSITSLTLHGDQLFVGCLGSPGVAVYDKTTLSLKRHLSINAEPKYFILGRRQCINRKSIFLNDMCTFDL